MMKFLPLLLFIVVFQLATAQCDTNRYQKAIFTSVFKHANVQYGEGQVWNIPYNNTDLFMDIYEPIGDNQALRPLMIWVHPGGFLTGDKEADDMVALCDSFAKRGYVTASIGYRLGFNPLSSSSAERAVYRGTQDIRAAIRYLKEFAPVYDIDTNYIFLGGSSAGGFATMHVAYLDQNEAPSSITGDLFTPNLGCLDCSGNTYNHTVDLKAIVNLWGALGDSTFVDSDETVPALLVHGTADGTVPFGVGNPFGVFTTPITHGSRCVSNQLTSFGIPHTNLFFEGQDHEPHGTDNGYFNNPPTPYWDTIFDAIDQHYWSQLKPENYALTGDNQLCVGESAWYVLPDFDLVSTCWNVANGTILSQKKDSIQILWNLAGNHAITYQSFSHLAAANNQKELGVSVSPLPNAQFTFNQQLNVFNFQSNGGAGSSYEWNFANLGNATEANPSFTFPANGSYVVELTVTSANGCVSSSTQTVQVQGLSVDELHANQIELYPNPGSTVLSMKNLPLDATIQILDAQGRLLTRSSNTKSEWQIETTNWLSGLYLVQVQHEGKMLVFKWIKE